jgi:prepilin signal peptidase PulO-like enzyme (type II secretory pathway)
MSVDAGVIAVFLAFALPISIIDVRSRRIPDRLLIPGCGFLLALRIFAAPESLLPALAAALFGAALFWIIRRATRGLGLGDVKFAAFMGLLCPLPQLLIAFLAAALLGIGAALIIIIRRKNLSLNNPVTSSKPVTPTKSINPIDPISPSNPTKSISPIDPVNLTGPPNPINLIKSYPIPFAPFLSAGALIAGVLGLFFPL